MYERYCKLRDKNGLRDADIAKELGFAKSTLSDWKRGKSRPNANNLYKIARLLNTTVEYLFTGESEENKAASEADFMRLTESLASRPALADLIRNAEKLDESKLIVINEIVQEFCKNNDSK
ncbi:MAG: helix-turn-helix transcriptional regulator [Lachnospiraceae bacterium]|nr:helix-turn-helix transcriptional regulator [Lachnospiraceae bacterium]